MDTDTDEEVSRDDVLEFFGDDTPPQDVFDDFPEDDPKGDEQEGADEPKGDEQPKVEPEPEPTDDPKPKEEGGDDDEEGEADILSKSGKYTIPYEKLTEARDSAKASKESEDTALAEVDRLKAELAALSNDGKAVPPPKDGGEYETGDLDELEEEFPGVAKSIKDLQDQIKTLTEANETATTKTKEDSFASHFDLIESSHENSQEMLASREFETWVDSQPSIVKSAYAEVYQHGTTEQVIEMLSAFVDATESETPKDDPPDTAGKDDDKAAEVLAAKIKAAKAKETIPNSLSDVPGAPSVTDPVEMLQTSSNSGKAVDELFAGKTPEQIDALVNKLL